MGRSFGPHKYEKPGNASLEVLATDATAATNLALKGLEKLGKGQVRLQQGYMTTDVTIKKPE